MNPISSCPQDLGFNAIKQDDGLAPRTEDMDILGGPMESLAGVCLSTTSFWSSLVQGYKTHYLSIL